MSLRMDERKMKKFLVMLLTLVMVFSCVACGGNKQESSSSGSAGSSGSTAEESWTPPSAFTFVASADVGSGFDTSARAFAEALPP